MNISLRTSFKVNSSDSRKISVNMITGISKCEYWYEFERQFEFVCTSLSAYVSPSEFKIMSVCLVGSKNININVNPTEIINMKANERV